MWASWQPHTSPEVLPRSNQPAVTNLYGQYSQSATTSGMRPAVDGFFAVVLGLLSWAPAPEDHHAAFRLAGSPRWPPAGGTNGCYPRRHPAAGARSSTVMVDRHQRTNRRGRSAECLGASPGASCEEAAACSFSD